MAQRGLHLTFEICDFVSILLANIIEQDHVVYVGLKAHLSAAAASDEQERDIAVQVALLYRFGGKLSRTCCDLARRRKTSAVQIQSAY